MPLAVVLAEDAFRVIESDAHAAATLRRLAPGFRFVRENEAGACVVGGYVYGPNDKPSDVPQHVSDDARRRNASIGWLVKDSFWRRGWSLESPTFAYHAAPFKFLAHEMVIDDWFIYIVVANEYGSVNVAAMICDQPIDPPPYSWIGNAQREQYLFLCDLAGDESRFDAFVAAIEELVRSGFSEDAAKVIRRLPGLHSESAQEADAIIAYHRYRNASVEIPPGYYAPKYSIGVERNLALPLIARLLTPRQGRLWRKTLKADGYYIEPCDECNDRLGDVSYVYLGNQRSAVFMHMNTAMWRVSNDGVSHVLSSYLREMAIAAIADAVADCILEHPERFVDDPRIIPSDTRHSCDVELCRQSRIERGETVETLARSVVAAFRRDYEQRAFAERLAPYFFDLIQQQRPHLVKLYEDQYAVYWKILQHIRDYGHWPQPDEQAFENEFLAELDRAWKAYRNEYPFQRRRRR